MKEPLELEFEEVIKSNKSTIYGICYMYGGDADEVADLFQDCLINIWKGLPGFLGNSGISTWIYRVCLNTCISADRKSKKRKEHATLDLTMDIASPYDKNNDQTKMLNERIAKLGPIDRAIVLLWLENLPYDEIGEIIGISAKNVGVRLYRIKEQLKSNNK